MSDQTSENRSVIDVMHAHASCRSFSKEAISEELLETLIEAGTRASTSSNMQAYTIISVDEPAQKRHLAKLCADQKQIHASAAFLAFCADMHRLQLCAEMHGADDGGLGQAEAMVTSLVDTTLVMQNVALAAESVGLGICMIGALRNRPFEVREALFLPKHVLPVAVMCLGWPGAKADAKPRLPLDAVFHKNRYRSDPDLLAAIEAYDGILSAFYQSQGLHAKDTRWSAVMAKRIESIKARADVGRLILEQGFDGFGQDGAKEEV